VGLPFEKWVTLSFPAIPVMAHDLGSIVLRSIVDYFPSILMTVFTLLSLAKRVRDRFKMLSFP
jgi:hypothetical protein